MQQKTVIIVLGPTASGKTSLAIQLAQEHHTEIISADSRQCFRELNIGVAKPDAHQLALVKHHFINSHSIHEEVTAATFAHYAEQSLTTIFSKSDVAIMAGGTGLYIRAFTDGLDQIPGIPNDIRDMIRKEYEVNGITWLQDELRSQDPLYASSGEMENPQRMMRALEVIRSTGVSIKEFHNTRSANHKSYQIKKVGINLPREILYDNINIRVDQMIAQGLEDEARNLYPYKHLNALQTVGYSEMFAYFDGILSRDQAIDKIKQNTRNYAKRQLTWFRKVQDVQWVDA